MKYYYIIFILLILIFVSCEKEPEIPTGQGNKIELSVTTNDLFRIDTNATATGSILNLGYLHEVVQHGHCWGVTPQPDTTYFHTQLGYKNTKGDFSSTLHNLNLNTTYYVRAYISNATHVAYGEQKIIKAVCGGLTEISYESQSYNIIAVGNQCWMAKNLNVAQTMVTSTISEGPGSDVSNNGAIEKYCYNNDINNCDTYGGLYDWDEMMAYSQTNTKGICPDGWHVPSNEDWEKLVWYLGGNYNAGVALKGNAAGQFNALLGGYRLSNGVFVESGIGTRFWSSSTNAEGLASYRYLTNNYNGVINKNYNKRGAFHVRCLKND